MGGVGGGAVYVGSAGGLVLLERNRFSFPLPPLFPPFFFLFPGIPIVRQYDAAC